MKIINLFKGLTKEYYLRQLFFGSVLLALFATMALKLETPNYGMIFLYVINTILYPYSRFAYEKIVGFVLGDNILFSNIVIFTMLKFFTILICWSFAIFIAPVGLLFIYFHQKKEEN